MGEQAVEDGLAIPLRFFASHLTARFGDNKIRRYEIKIQSSRAGRKTRKMHRLRESVAS